MVGKTSAFIMILKKNVSKHFAWAPIFSPIVLRIHFDLSTFMKIFFFGLIIISISILSCENQNQKAERLAKQHCGSCHIFPQPSLLEGLKYKRFCGIAVDGIKKYVLDEEKEIVIDYGNGECDKAVTITVNGVTHNINVN